MGQHIELNFYETLNIPYPEPTKSFSSNVKEIDINLIDFILKNHKKDFDTITLNKIKNVKSILENGGYTEFTSGNNDKDDILTQYGRKGNNNPLPMLWKKVKNSLMGHIYTDIDMVNSQFKILSSICNKLNWECSKINKYIKKRDEYLNRIKEAYDVVDTNNNDSRTVCKSLFIRLVNGGDVSSWIKDNFDNIKSASIIKKNGFEKCECADASNKDKKLIDYLELFREECENIRDKFWNDNDFILNNYNHNIKNETELKKIKRSAFCKILHIEENRILDLMIDYLENIGIEVKVCEFDGLRVLNNDKTTDNLLIDMSNYIKEKTGYEIDFDYKSSNYKYDVEKQIKKNEDSIKQDEKTVNELKEKYNEIMETVDAKHNSIPEMFSQYNLARMLLKLDNNFLWDNDILYNYNGYYWKRDNSKNFNSMRKSITHNLKPALKLLSDIAAKITVKEGKSPKICKMINDLYNNCDNCTFEKHIISQTQKLFDEKNIIWNRNTHLFQFENALLDTRKYRFIEPKKEYYINNSCGYDFNLELVNDDVKEDIKKFFKSCVYNHSFHWYMCYLSSCLRKENREELSVIITGRGSNGKSLTCALLQNVFNKYTSKLNASYFTEKDKKSGGANSSFYNCINSYLIITDEIDDTSKFQLERFKSLTSGEEQQVRNLYETTEQKFTPGRSMIFCNEFPDFTKIDGGISRRVLNLNYPYEFKLASDYDSNNPFHKKADTSLKLKFKNDITYRNSFISLLIDYIKEYDKLVNLNDFAPPEQIKNDTLEILNESSNIKQYIADYIIITHDKKDKLLGKDIYDDYCKKFNDEKLETRKQFYINFKQNCSVEYSAKSGKLRHIYKGLQFKNNDDDDEDEDENDED